MDNKRFKFKDLSLETAQAIRELKNPGYMIGKAYEQDYELEGYVRCLLASHDELKKENDLLKSFAKRMSFYFSQNLNGYDDLREMCNNALEKTVGDNG